EFRRVLFRSRQATTPRAERLPAARHPRSTAVREALSEPEAGDWERRRGARPQRAAGPLQAADSLRAEARGRPRRAARAAARARAVRREAAAARARTAVRRRAARAAAGPA